MPESTSAVHARIYRVSQYVYVLQSDFSCEFLLSRLLPGPSPLQRKPADQLRQCARHSRTTCRRGLAERIAAAAASIVTATSHREGRALADVSRRRSRGMSNATVGASAGVNTVLGEQNQALQRASDQAKREVDRTGTPECTGEALSGFSRLLPCSIPGAPMRRWVAFPKAPFI